MRRDSCLLFAMLLLGCGERPLEPRNPTPGVPHYRFVTYNVHFPEAGDTRTISVVRKTGADVVCLQETNESWRGALETELTDEYPHRSFAPLEGPAGLAVLSRYPLSETRLLPGPSGSRPAWIGTVQTPSGPIQVLNVHLRATFDDRGNPLRSLWNTEADHREEVTMFLTESSADVPRVIVGDFNEDVDGGAVRLLEDAGFRNALPLYHPGQPTWYGTSVAKQLAMALDHVLFDRAFSPLNSYVTPGGGSDHLAVMAHLEMPARAATP